MLVRPLEGGAEAHEGADTPELGCSVALSVLRRSQPPGETASVTTRTTLLES